MDITFQALKVKNSWKFFKLFVILFIFKAILIVTYDYRRLISGGMLIISGSTSPMKFED